MMYTTGGWTGWDILMAGVILLVASVGMILLSNW